MRLLVALLLAATAAQATPARLLTARLGISAAGGAFDAGSTVLARESLGLRVGLGGGLAVLHPSEKDAILVGADVEHVIGKIWAWERTDAWGPYRFEANVGWRRPLGASLTGTLQLGGYFLMDEILQNESVLYNHPGIGKGDNFGKAWGGLLRARLDAEGFSAEASGAYGGIAGGTRGTVAGRFYLRPRHAIGALFEASFQPRLCRTDDAACQAVVPSIATRKVASGSLFYEFVLDGE